jgi:hypothetical protein
MTHHHAVATPTAATTTACAKVVAVADGQVHRLISVVTLATDKYEERYSDH